MRRQLLDSGIIITELQIRICSKASHGIPSISRNGCPLFTFILWTPNFHVPCPDCNSSFIYSSQLSGSFDSKNTLFSLGGRWYCWRLKKYTCHYHPLNHYDTDFTTSRWSQGYQDEGMPDAHRQHHNPAHYAVMDPCMQTLQTTWQKNGCWDC